MKCAERARLGAAHFAVASSTGEKLMREFNYIDGSCCPGRRPRPLRDIQPGISDRPASAKPATSAAM